MREDWIRVLLVGAFMCFLMAVMAATFTSFTVLLLYVAMFVLLCVALRMWWLGCVDDFNDKPAFRGEATNIGNDR